MEVQARCATMPPQTPSTWRRAWRDAHGTVVAVAVAVRVWRDVHATAVAMAPIPPPPCSRESESLDSSLK